MDDGLAWGAQPHDLAAISAWRIGLKEASIEQGKLAIELEPNDNRLKDNMLWYTGEKDQETETSGETEAETEQES